MHTSTSKRSSRALVASALLIAVSVMLSGCEAVGSAINAQASAEALPTGEVYFGNDYGSDQAALSPEPALQPQAF